MAAFRPVGRRTRGPATDVVHGTCPDGRPGLAVVYDRRWWRSAALGDDLGRWWARLARPELPGVAPLVARAAGIFVYAAPPLRLLRDLLGTPAGVRAGLELVASAGELIAARPIGPHAGVGPELVGIDADGMAWVLGWRLPPAAVLALLDGVEVPPEAAQHAPPERFVGLEEDESADLYALVALAAMWMTGRPLFGDAAVERARAGEAETAVLALGLPDEVADLFSVALSASPADRPDVTAFLDEIERLIPLAVGPGAAAFGAAHPPPGDDTAWWHALFAGDPPADFADDVTAPRADPDLDAAAIATAERLAATRTLAEEVLEAALSEAGDCADDPAVAQLLGEIRAGVDRTRELGGEGAAVRAARALEATRRVRARIGSVIGAARERAIAMRARAAQRAAEEAESTLARLAASVRAAEGVAERVERLVEAIGRPADRLAPETVDVRDGVAVAAAVVDAQGAQAALAARVEEVRRVAIEVEFCADPSEAETRLVRLGALAEQARLAAAGIERAVSAARQAAEEERDRRRRAKLAGIREVASARAGRVDPVAAEVDAARVDLAASLEGDPVPPEIRGALAYWEAARARVQAHRDALAEALELVEAEAPAAKLSLAVDGALAAGEALLAALRAVTTDRERERGARQRARAERRVKAARVDARRSVAAADGSAAAGDRAAAAAELERLAGLRARVRAAQRALDEAERGDPGGMDTLAVALSAAAAELVACAADVDAVTAAARAARVPDRGERVRRQRRREGATQPPDPESADRRDALRRVLAIRRIAGADRTDVVQRRVARPASPEDGDQTRVFDPSAPVDDEE